MEVQVTHLQNPFSFFLKKKGNENDRPLKDEDRCHLQNTYLKKQWSDVNHGKYVAVWHNSKWIRGIVHMETQVLIWLVDYGYYVRPDESMVYVDLALEFKKLPTKVFEASIHGVVPKDIGCTKYCAIKGVIATTWNDGSIKNSQNIINQSRAIYFVPIALLCTKGNDVVLGDLYVDTPSQGMVNFIDLLELWPVHLQRNPAVYIQNISTFYSSRRKHHACILKPVMPRELPVVTSATITANQYETIVKNAPQLELADKSDNTSSDECSTVVTNNRQHNYLTADEIEEYSKKYIKINGIQHNVLNIIINKCHDLSMCERYKDKKSVGRATTRHSTFCGNQRRHLDESE
ncbi:uncharacterized protein LOC134741004 [Cydia strobilella]|uniref:uncharacterized protein LOC134741004 n=1 Tax=Cydia strobilella TaxID=1100964 RepID=UPI003007DC91